MTQGQGTLGEGSPWTWVWLWMTATTMLGADGKEPTPDRPVHQSSNILELKHKILPGEATLAMHQNPWRRLH